MLCFCVFRWFGGLHLSSFCLFNRFSFVYHFFNQGTGLLTSQSAVSSCLAFWQWYLKMSFTIALSKFIVTPVTSVNGLCLVGDISSRRNNLWLRIGYINGDRRLSCEYWRWFPIWLCAVSYPAITHLCCQTSSSSTPSQTRSRRSFCTWIYFIYSVSAAKIYWCLSSRA